MLYHWKNFFISCCLILMSGCGYHFQGPMHLAPPLHRLYLQTPDPYGYFTRILQQYLELSNVQLVDSPCAADTILNILQDSTSQDLISLSGTQITRQYNLKVTIVFEITNSRGNTIINPQTLIETRTITIQSNQILGSSNESNLYYQQMHRFLAYALMNRIASREITQIVNDAFSQPINTHSASRHSP